MSEVELMLRRAAGYVAKTGNANVARWRSDGLTSQMWTRGYADGILAAQASIARYADMVAESDEKRREDA